MKYIICAQFMASKEAAQCRWANGMFEEHGLCHMFFLPLYLHLIEGIKIASSMLLVPGVNEYFLSAKASEGKGIEW